MHYSLLIPSHQPHPGRLAGRGRWRRRRRADAVIRDPEEELMLGCQVVPLSREFCKVGAHFAITGSAGPRAHNASLSQCNRLPEVGRHRPSRAL